MPIQEENELRILMLKNRANTLTSGERDQLIRLLTKLRQDITTAEGIKTAAGVLLAHLVGKKQSEEERLNAA